MRFLVVFLTLILLLSCNDNGSYENEKKVESRANILDSGIDTCACFIKAIQLAKNTSDPISIHLNSKQLPDSCKHIISHENALKNALACDELQNELEQLDSVKMSELIRNSRFLFLNSE